MKLEDTLVFQHFIKDLKTSISDKHNRAILTKYVKSLKEMQEKGNSSVQYFLFLQNQTKVITLANFDNINSLFFEADSCSDFIGQLVTGLSKIL